MALGRLTPQYYQASGEATPQGKLPEKFQSTPVATSPIASQLNVGPDYEYDFHREPWVSRVPRGKGMWYLYSRGAVRQPFERVGQPGGVRPRPYVSQFQPNMAGPIRNGGFNNALFQAGYPGFNLGLSFKVPSIRSMQGPRTNMDQGSPMTTSSNRIVSALGRTTGAPPRR